ncbi:unnamed protein product [Didymodactylos carnosus]|uniref:Uncharacterized protein n=1 Tax=Didymodactylos carnosus TaxID=1234261 RepID=A0A8S2DS13_9BILA|nr:unnamed protein product [Didymodactylos carnosus]CAF3754389.1 unnamed protein product [Didymodactylos carnosus]
MFWSWILTPESTAWQKVTEIVSIFKDYQILIGESDSTDETWNYLKQWALIDSHVTIETYGELSKIYCSRSVRVAHCRNRLLDTARKNGWLREAPFYLVMDVDVNANNVLTLKNFLTNFEYPLEQWAVMTATQDTIYYDIWALRSHFVDYDCWQMVDNLANAGYCHSALVEKFVGNFQKPIPHEYGLIEVQSAFGGFGIYSTKYLNNCAYYAYTNYEICEHVTFHQCIKANGGRIFINSRFRNAGTYET